MKKTRLLNKLSVGYLFYVSQDNDGNMQSTLCIYNRMNTRLVIEKAEKERKLVGAQ